MEFWGLEVKPGQTIKCEPEDDHFLHLSQGALGESKKDDKATMYVKVGDKKLSSQFIDRRPAMSKAAAALIGLSWAPKLPSLPAASGSKKGSGPNPSISVQESLWKPSNELVDGLFVPSRDPRKVNKLARKDVKDTTGKGWFDMSTPSITPALKKDFEILQLRHVMDPKRHFKRSGKTKALPKCFQVGTVIEPAYEFFSSRLTKRERKTTLADELLSDPKLKNYRMRKIREIQETRTPGGNQKWKNKGRKTFKRAKDRRK